MILIGAALISTLLLTNLLTNLPIAAAHEVQTSGNVGATMHLEPNDNPQSGVTNLVWFALVREGGQPIALADCYCSLSVYRQPRQSGDPPLLMPALSPTSAEGRSGIPGANFSFPAAGTYDVVLRGRSVNAGGFAPFELNFPVTVAQ